MNHGSVERSLVKRRVREVVLGLFVAPHSADDSAGEVPFVDSSGFASGFVFRWFCGRGRRLCGDVVELG